MEFSERKEYFFRVLQFFLTSGNFHKAEKSQCATVTASCVDGRKCGENSSENKLQEDFFLKKDALRTCHSSNDFLLRG